MKKFVLLLCALTVFAASGVAWAVMSDEDFINLCQSGSVRNIQNAIKDGANVNAKDSHGMTALIVAAGFNTEPEVITTLIDAGADVDMSGKDGATALMAAVVNNPNHEIIVTLINAGADVGVKLEDGTTALALAKENDGLKGTDALKLLEERAEKH